MAKKNLPKDGRFIGYDKLNHTNLKEGMETTSVEGYHIHCL